MQNESFSSANGEELRRSTIESMQYPYNLDQQPSLSPLFLPATGGDLFYSYTPSPSPFSPSSQSTISTTGEDDRIDSEKRIYLARLALQYQDVTDRYKLCLSHLQEAADEAEALRHENARLRMANNDLSTRLTVFSKKQVNLLADEFNLLGIAAEAPETSPTSVLPLQPINENQLLVHAAERRAVLPKSISIRSSGYLKSNPTGPTGTVAKGLTLPCGPSSVSAASQQKVLVGVGNKKQEALDKLNETAPQKEQLGEENSSALEVDVYNQGMFKTELCNKWEEKGECPYGEHCQFAHGISELRPVLRHPRYKTELCRMVLTGDKCPYGHRCHFRHSVCPSDRLLLRP